MRLAIAGDGYPPRAMIEKFVYDLIGLVNAEGAAEDRLATIAHQLRTWLESNEMPSTTKVLRMRTFGVFSIFGPRGWEPGPPAKKGGELLQLLATYPRSVVTRDQLALASSKDVLPESIAHRLHLAASGARSYLRQVLAGFDAIRCVGHGYAWREEMLIDSDLSRFLGWYQQGTPESFFHAVDAYQGEFLAGEDAEWLQPTRVRCSCIYADMLERLALNALHDNRFADALYHALILTAVDRAHEGASRLVMRCFAALGRRASIVAEYEALRAFVREHLGADPSAETRRLYYSLIS